MIDWNKRNGGFLSPESVYNDQLGNLSQQINEKDKEIERLKNIIDELEKWLEYQADHTMQQHNYYSVLDKLKELKGSDK